MNIRKYTLNLTFNVIYLKKFNSFTLKNMKQNH